MMKHMNKAIATILASLALASCTPSGKVAWPKVEQCGASVGEDLVGVVSRVLLQGGSIQPELERIALKHGAGTVECVVQQLLDEWQAPGAAMSDQRADAIVSGQEFLESIGSPRIVR